MKQAYKSSLTDTCRTRLSARPRLRTGLEKANCNLHNRHWATTLFKIQNWLANTTHGALNSNRVSTYKPRNRTIAFTLEIGQVRGLEHSRQNKHRGHKQFLHNNTFTLLHNQASTPIPGTPNNLSRTIGGCPCRTADVRSSSTVRDQKLWQASP